MKQGDGRHACGPNCPRALPAAWGNWQRPRSAFLAACYFESLLLFVPVIVAVVVAVLLGDRAGDEGTPLALVRSLFVVHGRGAKPVGAQLSLRERLPRC